MDRRAELGQFLRSRRARLKPEETGLPDYGGRRRVPGLRREELAQLAGVSVDYYVRLEQGRTDHVSQAVLDAVARALRLGPDERRHLGNLARPRPAAREPRPVQRVLPGLRRLLDAMSDVPAYVLGPDTEVLAWNRPAAALITDFGALEPGRRQKARMIFLDEASRELYADWEQKAADVVAYLRLGAGRHPHDPGLSALIGELSMGSRDFARLWAGQEVRDKTRGSYGFRHPVVGPLELAFETFRLPDDPDQALVAYTVEPGSPSEAALRLLLSLEATDRPAGAPAVGPGAAPDGPGAPAFARGRREQAR
ncbi:helix-turn-helix transcriptional regulator [Kitasatospora herbaricolor]|uniref:Helix-turn-helix transcriptional regulator n=1 Tax=Kitasatospora herbaricolor TaxID=68217 RepID=A0ABZ1W2W8_9ACTN|nr:helix-turn-helix transcriptional regulator [Kitasatospora herbaricolor]